MFSPMAGEQTLAPRSLSKAVSIHGAPVLFQVTSEGSIEAPSLQYQLYASKPIDAETRRLAEDRIAFFQSLDAPPDFHDPTCDVRSGYPIPWLEGAGDAGRDPAAQDLEIGSIQ